MKTGSWMLFFAGIAAMAAVVSLGGIAGAALWIGQFFLFSFLIVCGMAFITGLRVVGE